MEGRLFFSIKMQCKPPSWFADKLKHLAQTGKLDLSGEAFDDLSFVGSRPSMKQLDLSFTPIQTIEGLQLQPKLDTLIADSSELVNFKNFRAVQKISSISIKNTPASHLPNFKLSLLIVIGPSLRVINGQYISSKLREKASQFPPIASDLINCGWMAEYPCPDESDLEKISQSYGLADIEEDIDEIPQSFVKQSAIDMEQTVDYYTSIHKKVIEQAHQQIKNASLDYEPFQLPPIQRDPLGDEENSFLSGLEADVGINLCDKVQILLHRHGYKVDQKNRAESMINIISKLLEIDAQESFEEEEEKVEVNNKISKISKNRQVESSHNDKKIKGTKRNENRSNENKPSEDEKHVKAIQNKKSQNQSKSNEGFKQIERNQYEKKSNQNKMNESNKSIEKKTISSKRTENENKDSRLKIKSSVKNDIDDDYETDNQDHLNDSYNDNSISNYNNSFEDNYNINISNDYEYDDFNESKHTNDYSNHKQSFDESPRSSKNNKYDNITDSNNDVYDNFNENDMLDDDDDNDNSNSNEYFKKEYNYSYSNRLRVNDDNDYDNDNENTEKEVDITFDSINKEQMNTSGIDNQFFELADRCSSQSDITDYQADDIKWKQFVAQLENEG